MTLPWVHCYVRWHAISLKSHCHPGFFAHRGEENITRHSLLPERGRSNGELLSISGKGNENDDKYPDLAAKFH